MDETIVSTPLTPPGSEAAIKKGCTCAVMDNSYGKGRYGDGEKYGWWITQGCPLHAPATTN